MRPSIKLKALWMRAQGNIRNLTAVRRLDHGEGAIAIADVKALGLHVETNVVRILAQIDASDAFKLFPYKHSQRPVPAARHVDGVARCHIANALRLLQVGDAVNDLSQIEVDNSNAVVAELGDEQSLAARIECQVIDPTLYLA